MTVLKNGFVGASADQRLLSRWGGWVSVLHDEHVGGVRAERDAIALEGFDDAAAELAENTVLLVGSDADDDGVDDLAAFDGVEARNIGVGHDDLLEGGVIANLGGNGAEHGEDVIGIGAGIHAEVQGGNGEVAGEVRDSGDLAVWDDVQGAIAVAQVGAAEAHVFNGAGEGGDLDHFANVELVLEQDEDAIDHVFEDGLRAKADAHPKNAGRSEKRREIDVEDREDVQKHDESDDAEGRGADDGGHGAKLRGALRVADLAIGEAEHPVDEELNDAGEDERKQENDGDAREIVLDEIDDVVVPTTFEALDGSFFRCGRLNLQCEAGEEHDLGEPAFCSKMTKQL